LHKDGKDFREFEFKENLTIVLGDQKGLDKKAEKFLERFKAEKVSLGKVEYLASACISIIHNELDRRNLC
jgi:tRNA pseudouridine-54 N-methylase